MAIGVCRNEHGNRQDCQNQPPLLRNFSVVLLLDVRSSLVVPDFVKQVYPQWEWGNDTKTWEKIYD
jgi:hypothetical protein